MNPLTYKLPSPTDLSIVEGHSVHSDKVLDWRQRRFREMGFAPYVANFLAVTHIDLHRMQSLLDQGCSHDFAASILMGTSTFGEDANWIDPVMGEPVSEPVSA